LLVAGPVKLPLLGVDMPLFAFYGFAPPMFVVLHLYVLMQLYLLAPLLRRFDYDLIAADVIEHDRQRVRDQLDKFVFTQLLIGEPRALVVRMFLRVTVWLSFVIGPVLLLLGFQLQFLPYHSVQITNVHRVVLLLDMVLLGLTWPGISRVAVWQRGWSRVWPPAVTGLCGLLSVALIVFSFLIATIPGEPDPDVAHWNLVQKITFYFQMKGLVVRSLMLADERLVEPDQHKLSRLVRTLSLGHRDLRYGYFGGADLRKADLHDADLTGADLSDASFVAISSPRPSNHGADLSGADLRDAILKSIILDGADLNHADLSDATLENVSADKVILAGADLRSVKLGNTSLTNADLRDADLTGVRMTDANYLSGADLTGAHLTDADLHEARDLVQDSWTKPAANRSHYRRA
jgi:uncharacterized protein YjbI with pentapeptide repeats